MNITDHIDLLYPSSDARDRAERRRIKMRDSGSLYIKDLMIGDIKNFITLTGSDKLLLFQRFETERNSFQYLDSTRCFGSIKVLRNEHV